MDSDINLDIQDLNYNQLVFRHIDRIQSVLLTSSSKNDRVFYYNMGVQGLISMIPDNIRDKKFKDKLEELRKKRKDILAKKDFDLNNYYSNVQEMFEMCMNQLDRFGFFFKRVASGDPDER